MWVGLSATLLDSEQFFGKLTGISPDFVREVVPLGDDLERRGHEYQLLLRGDPTSQTALLSTSIQSLMLLLRLLDPLGSDESKGFFGSKVFAFCDNLDLTNRLYRQLLDAEGRDPVGKIDPKKNGSLALLRSEAHSPQGRDTRDWPERDRSGQNWWLVDRLRDSPTPPAIGRTSSQDTGVSAEAETIVATASLEVGFDDPTVGAVLQHKAPRDFAQFIQRRGRAGRSQAMRPWTVVVLSDYGRDRVAYQSYERLLDPTLPPKTLPMSNRSVQRMQATFAVMDWVAEHLRKAGLIRGSVRNDLSVPDQAQAQARQEAVRDLLAEVLRNEVRRSELTTFLERSLRLSTNDVQILLWEGPRAVLLEAIPTAVRRLASNWHIVRNGTAIPRGDRARNNHPLPEFVPANLFSDLCLPEIQVMPPPGYDEAAETEEPVFLVLNQFAPGNVTLRYAVWKTKGLWIDPLMAGARLDVSDAFLQDAETIAQVSNGDSLVDVIRPFSVHPAVPDREIQTTSRGRFTWNARFTTDHDSIEADLPSTGPWTSVVERADFYLQAGRGGIRLLRYTLGGVAEVGKIRGERTRVQYELAREEEPVALGVELDVDALRVRIRPPSELGGFSLHSDTRRLRQLRRDYFLWLVEEQVGSSGSLNPFLARWIGELTLSAVAFSSINDGHPDDPASWTGPMWYDGLLDAFDRAFQGLHGVRGDVNGDPPLREAVEAELHDKQLPETLAKLYALASAGPDDTWSPWLNSRFGATAAFAVHEAIQALLSDFDADTEVTIDIDESDGFIDIWITDTSVGGGGLIESLYPVYAEDPRRFWTLALGALEPHETEQAADMLRRTLTGLVDGGLGPKAEDYRTAHDDESALKAWQALMHSISRSGIPASHSLAVGLATRLMRPGSSAASDRAVLDALNAWEHHEGNLGFALDQRTACSLLSENRYVIDALHAATPGNPGPATGGWAFNVLLDLLWPTPEELRPFALQAPMPFTARPPMSERTLLLDVLSEGNSAQIDVADQGWRAGAEARLAATGQCTLYAMLGDEDRLRDGLVELMIEPIEVGSLHLHPRIIGVRRQAATFEARLELVEAPQ
jgi:hypothetical protein